MYGMVGRDGMQAFAGSLQISSSKERGRGNSDDEHSCHTPAKAARPGGELGGDPTFAAGPAGTHMASVVASRAYADGRAGTTVNALAADASFGAGATFDVESSGASTASSEQGQGRGCSALGAVLWLVSLAAAGFASRSMGMATL
eukprot:COSAG06_NODE_19626_length_830_cov_0.922025_1_plen_144_part_10